MSKVLIIDHYDSFVYNITRYVERLGYTTEVVRCDAASAEALMALKPSHIIFSPGPCGPLQTGVSMPLMSAALGNIPILGICLGAQALAVMLGGIVIRAIRPRHGQGIQIEHDGSFLFEGLSSPMHVGLYHSLMIDSKSLPSTVAVTACCPEGQVMAIAHQTQPAWGVQFHPESVLTPQGHRVLSQFLNDSKVSV